jgi:hypothetical protein
MHALGNVEMLEIVERGNSQSYPERAVLMLAMGCPDRSLESIARLGIGARDELLLALRQRTFGSQLHGTTDCPSCDVALTVDLNIDDLRSNFRKDFPDISASVADYQICLRSPNSEDLVTILQDPSPDDQPANRLARRVVQRATRAGVEVPVAELPEAVLDQVSDLIEASSPEAELRLAMNCPDCGCAFHVVLDAVSFFWNEITAEVRKLLLEVHSLASAYGWSEHEILRMSPWRRAMYLGMVD